MNLTKTRSIWLGSKRIFKRKNMSCRLGTWVYSSWKEYDSRDLQNITILNCGKKEAEIDKLMLNWSRRDTTRIGRTLIIKTLALSTLEHFLSHFFISKR